MKKSVLFLLFFAGALIGLFFGNWITRSFYHDDVADHSDAASLVSADAYLDIHVMYDGRSILPEDAAGHPVRPVSIGGVIYVPASSFEKVGYKMDYNESTGVLFYVEDGVEYSTGPLDVPVYYASDEIPVTELPEQAQQRYPVYLSTGAYVVGEDLPAGKYNAVALSGHGNFMGDVASLGWLGLNEILNADSSDGFGSLAYNGLLLSDGDTINIRGDLSVRLDPVD